MRTSELKRETWRERKGRRKERRKWRKEEGMVREKETHKQASSKVKPRGNTTDK